MYCAVFVREASIRLVEHAVVPLAVEAKAWAAANPGPVSTEVLEALQKSKDHVLLTRLTHLGTGRDFVVVSTRFSVKDRAELQAVQAALLCQTTVALLKQWGLDSTSNAPVMLCGDLHSQPRHGAGHGGAQGAYLLLTEGNLSPEHADHPGYQTTGTRSKSLNSSLLKLRSVYATCESGNEPLFTCNTSSFQGTRDYIMVGGALSIIDKLGMPYAEGQGVGYPTLPNQVRCSPACPASTPHCPTRCAAPQPALHLRPHCTLASLMPTASACTPHCVSTYPTPRLTPPSTLCLQAAWKSAEGGDQPDYNSFPDVQCNINLVKLEPGVCIW